MQSGAFLSHGDAAGNLKVFSNLTFILFYKVLFLFELGARMYYAKNFLSFAKEGQNQLDFILVALNVADTLIIQTTGAGGSNLRMLTVFI